MITTKRTMERSSTRLIRNMLLNALLVSLTTLAHAQVCHSEHVERIQKLEVQVQSLQKLLADASAALETQRRTLLQLQDSNWCLQDSLRQLAPVSLGYRLSRSSIEVLPITAANDPTITLTPTSAIAIAHIEAMNNPCRSTVGGLPCADPEHWRIQFEGRDIGMGRHDLDLLQSCFLEVASDSGARVHPHALSNTVLQIFAPQNAPWAIVSKVIERSAAAGIWRIDFCVRDRRAPAALRIIPFRLPRDGYGVDSYAPAQNTITITISYVDSNNSVSRQVNEKSIPEDLTDDAALSQALATWARRHPAGAPGLQVILDPGLMVQWQYIISTIESALRAGLLHIEFKA